MFIFVSVIDTEPPEMRKKRLRPRRNPGSASISVRDGDGPLDLAEKNFFDETEKTPDRVLMELNLFVFAFAVELDYSSETGNMSRSIRRGTTGAY